MRNKLDFETANRFFSYDPETGVLSCKAKYGRKVRVGEEVGTLSTPYRIVGFQWGRYPAHCIAWLLMTGEWPAREVDHRDLNKRNNRWANLRLASKVENQGNTGLKSDNTSGIKGVSWHKHRNRWRASIQMNGKPKHLGLFSSKNEAAGAYALAARSYFGEFARTAGNA